LKRLPAVFLTLAFAAARAQTPAASLPAQVDAIYPDIEALYTDLHRHPELAYHEQQTAAKLASRMKALGFEVTEGVGRTGIVAVMRNGSGHTAMLRTELDALPVQEKTGLPYASTVIVKNEAGESIPVMHACGHDVHMSGWLGTATLMAKNRDRWHGTLVMIGQPAEEGGEGALAMLKDGLFTRFPRPDYALSIHDEATLPAGVLGYHPGPFRASADFVEITIIGRGGHGAEPQETVDPVVIAARTVLALQTLVSRENNPMDPVVITIGTIHGGTKNNIIPDQVKLQLTVRTFSDEVRERVLAGIERVAKGEAMAGGAPSEPVVHVIPPTQHVVVNDAALTARMAAAAKAAMGEKRVVEMPAKMTSEDFSEYGRAGIPAVLLHIGAIDPAKLEAAKHGGPPVPATHSPQWAPVREPTLKAFVVAETAIMLDLLGGK
jgi:hippurate hydrolase